MSQWQVKITHQLESVNVGVFGDESTMLPFSIHGETKHGRVPR